MGNNGLIAPYSDQDIAINNRLAERDAIKRRSYAPNVGADGDSVYPNFTDDDVAEMDRIEGDELSKKYSAADLGSSAQQMMRDDNIIPGSTSVDFSGHIPSKFNLPKNVSNSLGDKAGVTLYDPNNPKKASVFVDPAMSPKGQLVTTHHELEHVRQNQAGNVFPTTPQNESNQNVNPHFPGEKSGQLFNYETNDALNSMVNNIGEINDTSNYPLQSNGLVNSSYDQGNAIQNALQKRQQQLGQNNGQ